MGVDVRYYIGGFDGPTRQHEEVIKAAKELRYGYKDNMELDVMDDPNSKYPDTEWYSANDGFCVVDSMSRANKPEYQEDIDDEIARLKTLFPGHPIHQFNDHMDREDVVELLKDYPYEERVA